MPLAEKFSILVLILSIGAQLFGRSLFGKCVKPVFVFSVLGNFGYAFYLSFLQYHAFLQPFREWPYFAYYVGWRFFSPIIVALVFALAAKFISEFLNPRFNERFLEKEESWLLALGVFLTGYPGFLFYIPLMLVVGLFISAFYHFFGKGRAPFFYAWLPVAIFAILLKSLIPQSALNFLII
ncbi:MAG: hypothetical protein A3B13_03280 [Candidatus Liptonbacteria bacterium RIFCSPLOWO2_01_FULL_45_15]|uniref:Prepilin type IV endopeptidase peptidase domain-containing protein n=1 Tax=Candidatus Liptonbacteria bacterium RIFCSPLOWO2_01_FULL_45_15 TaxID=1798649 RepID=A0A1G2CIR3_9BACT|nr:MAG: hypothetical protein A3B13_03280 [Candidatus Liptonbacteria bacterium RIFCSPLOWO2_01_FULL_45_15]